MAAAIGTSSAAPKAVPMARKLAYRNLFHDQLSLFVTLVGIVFSVVLARRLRPTGLRGRSRRSRSGSALASSGA